jgi:WD40 repeat protein
MNVDSESALCAKCGNPLPRGLREEFCPVCSLRGALDVAKGEPLLPATIRYVGDYELLEPIARGGMGIVYRARQTSLGRIVAVKMILAGQFASPEARARFRAEASAAAKLQHPNIVAIHEIGEHDGQPYFSMELVEGATLADLVRDGPLPAERAAGYAQAIALAVHHAHTQGILHRDLKPSNVLLDAFDQPRVTDFGLARQLGEASDLTESGQMLGSPSFVAPEQARGDRGRIGPRSDVYSLGAILYHLLTARPPFQGDTIQAVIRQVENNEPVAPRRLNPGVPADLETVALKCLEKEPARRYSSAQELADDLGRFLAGEAVRARPISPPGRAWRWCHRRPAVAGLLATVLVVVVAGFTGVLWQWRRAESHVRSESVERGRAEHALGLLELQRAEDLLQSDRAADALACLAAILRKHPTNDAVATRIAAVLSQRSFALPAHRPLEPRSESKPAELLSMEFSPDGKRMVTVSADFTAQVWDVVSGRPLAGPLRHTDHIVSAYFSPDGERVVTASFDKTARVWNVITGEAVTPALAHGDVVARARFSPDGRKVITASVDGTARVWAADDGRPLFPPILHGSRVVSAQFSDDGRRILTASLRDGLILVSDANSGQIEHRLHLGGRVNSASFSPDGERIAIIHSNQWVSIRQLPDGREIARVHHRSLVNVAVFSPDGELLATVGEDRRALLWDGRTGELFAELPGHQTSVQFAEFSQDGLRLQTREMSNRACVWDVLTGRRIGEPIRASGPRFISSFRPDGQTVAVPTMRGDVEFWTAAAGQARPLKLAQTNAVSAARLSPDGRRIVTGAGDGWVTLWNAGTGARETAFKHDAAISAMDLSPDGTRVLCAFADGTVCVRNLVNGEQRIVRPGRGVTQVEFSPDGSWFMTVTSEEVVTWATGSGARRFPGSIRHEAGAIGRAIKGIWHAAISPDGQLIGTASGQYNARLWDAATGQPRSPDLSHRRDVRQISFRPDGRQVVTASIDHTAVIWSVPAGERLVEFEHGGQLGSARFSPDGQRIVTASFDNTARVWDARTARPLTEPLRHRAEVSHAEFSPDGRWVLTTSLDSATRVWDAHTGKPLSESMQHPIQPTQARFTPDGSRLLTLAGQVHLWELPALTTADRDRLADLAEGVAGQRLDESGAFQTVESKILFTLKESLRPNDPRLWLKWFLADRTTRSLSPSLPVAEDSAPPLATADSFDGLVETIRRSPTNGLAYARLAQLILRQEGYEEPQRSARAEVWSRRAMTLAPAQPSVWLARAHVLRAAGKVKPELDLLNEATRRFSGEWELWHRKGQAQLAGGTPADAVSTLKQAALLCPRRNQSPLRPILRDLREAIFQSNSPHEAIRQWLSFLEIPERAAVLPHTCLDLSAHYNAALHEDWHGASWKGQNLAVLPNGLQTFAGVVFDVRGIIQLAGTGLDAATPGFPPQVSDIVVCRRADRLHFLHATGWGSFVSVGTVIGQYQVRYSDGTRAIIPIVTGQDLLEWAGPQPEPVLKNASVAWAGRNARGFDVRLFKRTWENPRPDAEIAFIDFISARTVAAPFLIALTAE